MGKRIMLSTGGYTLVDTADFEYLNQFKWHKSALGYVVRKTPKQEIDTLSKPYITRMHCVIMQTPSDMTTDHISGDKLDNRRSNLRICTRQQNLLNRKRISRSGIKGVRRSRNGKAWEARIKGQHLGTFDSAKTAALAYNKQATKMFGEYAYLNKLEVIHE